eukprot:CAMPEP_0202446178 /NCGR_PEP_ID=MMETSP1360-20130828/4775_1 /ASSEMBLY_ACC=CAM_ASM_000848 /TAXON_ID=515479 /ORGANISM="Licmophora paradoxa, Strain CCMP2313" /LENGTH=174 /DNA_ID=CAMNT_0049062621 /DNA_START=253 /DNA_END=780 /DNA_ORIENTATION=-
MERYHKKLEQMELIHLEAGGAPGQSDEMHSASKDITNFVLPLGRIKKIAKLDPDVKNLSKEAIALIGKTTEFVIANLAIDVGKVAQLQNRRKLLPEDVAQVCSTRDRFAFLRQDIQDLVREAEQERKNKQQNNNASRDILGNSQDKKIITTEIQPRSSKPLTAYFPSTATGKSS